MEKTIRQKMKVTWVLKALMAAYVVTGLLLLLLTLLVYKMEFSEEKVTAGDYSDLCTVHICGRTCDRKAFQNEKIFVGTCGRNFIFRVIAFDFLWDLSYLTRKWDEYFDVVPALCGRLEWWVE